MAKETLVEWAKKGLGYALEGNHIEALKYFNKYLKQNPKDTTILYNKGIALDSLMKYEEAISCFDICINYNSNDVSSIYQKGIALCSLNRLEESLECFNHSLRICPNLNIAIHSKAFTLSFLNRDREAIIYFDKGIIEDANNSKLWYGKGRSLKKLKQYKEAIECFDKSYSINVNYDILIDKGISLIYLEMYLESIDCFNEFLLENPKSIKGLNNKGIALYYLKRFDEAIECYGMCLKEDSNNQDALVNLGQLHDEMKDYEKALFYLDKCLEVNLCNKIALRSKGIVLSKMEKYQEASECFLSAKDDILTVLVGLASLGLSEEIQLLITREMLNKDLFFSNVILKLSDKSYLEFYSVVYLRSLQIVSLLHVDREEESEVAHYTKIDTIKHLLFNKSSFRLTSIHSANDPQEGNTLLYYLWGENSCNQNIYEFDEYRAFIGCFTFNQESLNQFRLYGKENGIEATGGSMVFNRDFFSDNIKRTLPFNYDIDIDESHKKKQSLFRCIYIDPQTGRLISIGHKESYTFFRDNLNVKEDTINAYNEYITNKLEEVRKRLNNLKFLITNFKEKITPEEHKKVILVLLTHLRFLTKHVAFKEEQECRIFRVESLSSSYITSNGVGLFINYDEITPFVSKLYFGAKAKDMKLIEDMIPYYQLDVECCRCRHPFFT